MAGHHRPAGEVVIAEAPVWLMLPLGSLAWLIYLLVVAAEHVLRERDAEKWDEGFDAGERDAMSHDTFDEPCIANPYRRLDSMQ
jgi:hypothetical protein